ncbi:hypothetical protein BJX99DRAFT_5475 [Aspergillus californicus]
MKRRSSPECWNLPGLRWVDVSQGRSIFTLLFVRIGSKRRHSGSSGQGNHTERAGRERLERARAIECGGREAAAAAEKRTRFGLEEERLIKPTLIDQVGGAETRGRQTEREEYQKTNLGWHLRRGTIHRLGQEPGGCFSPTIQSVQTRITKMEERKRGRQPVDAEGILETETGATACRPN